MQVTQAKIKKDIRKISAEELKEILAGYGEKAFKVKQIQEWLWKKSVTDFEQMNNLSKSLREKLHADFEIRNVKIFSQQKSEDGTVKLLFSLHEGHKVEGVLIPTEKRMTACISSQVGCSLACKFCATGYMPRLRNLDAAEIYDQVVLINQIAEENYGKGLSNVVYMGMGEPLLNYANVLESVRYLTADGLGMASSRITVSTAGIAKMIRKLGDDKVKFNLALSLHAADDLKRNEIMAINESNNLEVLRDALKYYFAQTKNPVTYEYIVFQNFNDEREDAEKLYRFSRHLPSKVNIIEYNPIAEADYVNTSQNKLDAFAAHLERRGVNVRVRRSRGKDIDAACGQLAIKNEK